MKILAALLLLAAAANAETLAAILAHMDRDAKNFKSVSAKTKDEEWIAVIDETNTQTGEMAMKRTKKGVVGIMKFGDPDPRVFHIDGSKLEEYYPKANTVNIYDAGKNTQVVNQFVLLGFGTSGAELQKQYTIRVVGPEKVGSASTTHLELIPRSSEMQKYITKLELWIQEGESNPTQEKLTFPSKNYSFYHFSDVKVNPSLADSAFDLKLPPNVKTITPQK